MEGDSLQRDTGKVDETDKMSTDYTHTSSEEGQLQYFFNSKLQVCRAEKRLYTKNCEKKSSRYIENNLTL